jgi:hypothetical protein
MKSLLLSAIFLLGCSTSVLEAAPVKKEIRTAQLAPGSKVRTAQQDAELKEWIIGIQKLAQDAQKDAENAEREAALSRSELVAATENADTLQQAINAQGKQLNQALTEKKKAQEEVVKLTKKNNFLENILGIEAALIAILACLWLRVPSMGTYGLIATVAAPIVIFSLVKLIL